MIGDTLRREGLAGTILKGVLENRKRIGRQRLEYAKQITEDLGFSGYCDMKRLAEGRNGWRAVSNQSQDC